MLVWMKVAEGMVEKFLAASPGETTRLKNLGGSAELELALSFDVHRNGVLEAVEDLVRGVL
jgi:hypothetical protein